MLNFIIKGIFRDRHRYLFPLIIVSVGVGILVFMMSFMTGYIGSFINHTAMFDTGHLKVVTRAYAEMLSLKPVDLALLDIEPELEKWSKAYPQLVWKKRISFGALLDVPDSLGETRAQGEVAGFAVDLLGSGDEAERLNLSRSLVKGRLPKAGGELLLSSQAFDRLDLKLDDEVTLIGSTVDGAMAMMNFRVVGAVNFGVTALDKGAVVADFADIESMLALEGGASEILAWFKDGNYNKREVWRIKEDFNSRFSASGEYAPVMLALYDQNNLGYLIKVMDSSFSIMNLVFVLILAIVLWNSGLMNGIRRWGEFGVRLAIGEKKIHVYRSLIGEALVIGVIGSLIGTLLGLMVSLYYHEHGFDMTAYGQNSTIMAENIIYPAINFKMAWIGFVPGVASTVLGAVLAGLAIFKRQTSQLFKELEV
jgi:putative ABC transport system permease protein